MSSAGCGGESTTKVQYVQLLWEKSPLGIACLPICVCLTVSDL